MNPQNKLKGLSSKEILSEKLSFLAKQGRGRKNPSCVSTRHYKGGCRRTGKEAVAGLAGFFSGPMTKLQPKNKFCSKISFGDSPLRLKPKFKI